MTRIFVLLFIICSLAAHAQNAPKPQYGTDVQGVFGLVTGKTAEFFSPGFGVQAGMFYDFEENLRFTAMLGYMRFGVNADGIREEVENAGEGTADVSGGTSGFPLTVGLRLMTPGPDMRFYGAIEGGMYFYQSSVEGTHTQTDGTVIRFDESEFRSEPGFNFALGILSPIGENLLFHGAATYHFIRDSKYAGTDTWGDSVNLAASQFISIALGVTWTYDL